MAGRKKITMAEENCWIIRSITPKGNVRYMESYKQWNKSPAYATIFRDYDAGIQMMWLVRKTGLLIIGEVLDVVPLYGALLAASKSNG